MAACVTCALAGASTGVVGRSDVDQYLAILRKAMETGVDRDDRTGTGTRAIFGEVMRFRMSDGFPAVTTKRLAFRSVLAELLWFIAGSSDINELHALGTHIWDGNANAAYWTPRARFDGDAGRNYGQQWRDWIAPNGDHVDALPELVAALMSDSSRSVTSSGLEPWRARRDQPARLPRSLPDVRCRRKALADDVTTLLRSVPRCSVQMAQYAVLLHLMAQFTDSCPRVRHVLADAHIYPRSPGRRAPAAHARRRTRQPRLALDPSLRSLDDVVARYRDILGRARAGEKPGPLLDAFARLEQYQFHPPIEAKMAV